MIWSPSPARSTAFRIAVSGCRAPRRRTEGAALRRQTRCRLDNDSVPFHHAESADMPSTGCRAPRRDGGERRGPRTARDRPLRSAPPGSATTRLAEEVRGEVLISDGMRDGHDRSAVAADRAIGSRRAGRTAWTMWRVRIMGGVRQSRFATAASQCSLPRWTLYDVGLRDAARSRRTSPDPRPVGAPREREGRDPIDALGRARAITRSRCRSRSRA